MGCMQSSDGADHASSHVPLANVGDSAPKLKRAVTIGEMSVENIFQKYDSNGDGMLTTDEFENFTRDAFSGEINAAEIKALLEVDKSGSIGMNELRAFLRFYARDQLSCIKTKSALIIVDVQNDFITGSLANQYNAEKIIPVINGIRNTFDFVVVSLDWHPYDHCSFVESANEGKIALAGASTLKTEFAPFSMVTLKGDTDRAEHEQRLYPRHGVQGSKGAECHPELVINDTDGTIYKGTKPNIDSYSAFFDNCKAYDTGLTRMLEDKGITHVFVCGLVTDVCVKSTALHGAEAGFVVSVVEDASRPLDKKAMPDVKDELAAAGISVIRSEEAVKIASTSTKSFLAHMKQVARGKHAATIHQKNASCGHLGTSPSSPSQQKD